MGCILVCLIGYNPPHCQVIKLDLHPLTAAPSDDENRAVRYFQIHSQRDDKRNFHP